MQFAGGTAAELQPKPTEFTTGVDGRGTTEGELGATPESAGFSDVHFLQCCPLHFFLHTHLQQMLSSQST